MPTWRLNIEKPATVHWLVLKYLLRQSPLEQYWTECCWQCKFWNIYWSTLIILLLIEVVNFPSDFLKSFGLVKCVAWHLLEWFQPGLIANLYPFALSLWFAIPLQGLQSLSFEGLLSTGDNFFSPLERIFLDLSKHILANDISRNFLSFSFML